jgi:hypothetical protein
MTAESSRSEAVGGSASRFEPNARSFVAVLIAAIALLTLFDPSHITAQAPPSITLIEAAKLLDPRTGNVVAPAGVLTANLPV